jgi:hypothetical protein
MTVVSEEQGIRPKSNGPFHLSTVQIDAGARTPPADQPFKTMKITTLLLLTVAISAWSSAQDAAAATVPGGAHLVVRTLDVITSADAPGTKFHTELVRPVSVQGRVVLPAGTKIMGRVETSRRMVSKGDSLSVNLSEVIVGGRPHALRTTGAVHPVNFHTSRGVAVTRGYYNVARGKILEFRLAEPLQL